MEMDRAPIVEARALRKDYGATRAVDDISFKVARGEVVGFLGPNGAGKSTTQISHLVARPRRLVRG